MSHGCLGMTEKLSTSPVGAGDHTGPAIPQTFSLQGQRKSQLPLHKGALGSESAEFPHPSKPLPLGEVQAGGLTERVKTDSHVAPLLGMTGGNRVIASTAGAWQSVTLKASPFGRGGKPKA